MIAGADWFRGKWEFALDDTRERLLCARWATSEKCWTGETLRSSPSMYRLGSQTGERGRAICLSEGNSDLGAGRSSPLQIGPYSPENGDGGVMSLFS